MTSEGAVNAPRCEHTAVLYPGANDLSYRLGSTLRRAAAEAEAVLRPGSGQISDRTVSASRAIRPMRGMRVPGKAMAAFDRFVTAAEASGAASAWSIAAIPLRADGHDARWIQYDEALNKIFVHRPLRAVRLYDANETPAQLRHDVERTHESLIGDWARRDGNDAPGDLVVPFPSRRSHLIIRDPRPAVARAVVERLRGWVSRELLEDLQLVASEVVTNAVVHGARPTVFKAWHEADG